MRILRLVGSELFPTRVPVYIQSLLVEDVDQCFPTFLGLPHPTAEKNNLRHQWRAHNNLI